MRTSVGLALVARTSVYKNLQVPFRLNPDMDLGSEEAEIPLVRTNQELSATSARDFLQTKEHVTALPPINPLGGTVFLYHSPGKEGEHAQLRIIFALSRKHNYTIVPLYNVLI